VGGIRVISCYTQSPKEEGGGEVSRARTSIATPFTKQTPPPRRSERGDQTFNLEASV